MNIPHYIYIDDEKDDSITSLIHGLNDTHEVCVELFNLSHNETFDSLMEKIRQSVIDNNINGILIDLCLNGEGINRLNFTAAPIAQHLRSLASEKSIQSLPIILCSTDEKLKRTYNADKVSHDLYDYKFVKSHDIKWRKVRAKMKSLADGYPLIAKEDLSNILNISIDEIRDFDSRIFDRFLTEKGHAPHEYAQFIIKDLMQHPGILIKERTLAARLGIDIDQSPEWPKLLGILEPLLRYTGVFADGWQRFWSHRLNNLFQELSGGVSWVSLNAEDRVHIISHTYGINEIKAALPLKFASSSYFDTICEFTKRPLDSMEGYEVYESYELRPWQDPKYISFLGIAQDTYHHTITVKESELERFKIYREDLLK